MKTFLRSAIIGMTAVGILSCSRKEHATLILYNANIYTVNESKPKAKALAIRDDKIVAVGWNEEIRTTFDADRAIDLKGVTVFPGFTDAHAHLESLGLQILNLNLTGTTSVKEIQDRVAARIAQLSIGTWLRGRSWDQNDWDVKEFPTHQMLDDVAGEHPVYLRRIDGHAVWVNKRALELAGVNTATPDPAGGKILRDNNGNPTGVLIDNAIDLIDAVLPPLTFQERYEAIQQAVQACLQVGLTEVHDMGVDLEGIEIYKRLIAEKKFPFRVYAAIGGTGKTWQEYLQRGPEIATNDRRLTVRALKLYADGALGSRGAALLQPYADEPGNAGLALTALDTLRRATNDAMANGFQVCVHAIGDKANRDVLNIYEDVFKSNASDGSKLRFRVEHAQVVSVDDIPRFAKLGVLPSMQPTHCTSDMYWAEQRVGAERIKGAYAWRSFIDNGSIIPGGSDFPVESANPLLGFYAAVTRQDAKGWPEEGWYVGQRMTREEALQSFTQWAAYAAFEEQERGSIEVGKLADLAILSNDIMTCQPREILETRVEYTIVAGQIAYARTEEKHE